MKQKQAKEIKRFTQYMIGGGAQFWVGYGAFALFDLVFHMSFWPAKLIAYAMGISLNFFIERFWAFRKKGLTKRQLHSSAQRYYGLMIINFILDQAIVGGLFAAGLTPYIGQFGSA
jgi:putative flippase GtrA